MPLYFDKLDDYLLPDSETITTFLTEEHEEEELDIYVKELHHHEILDEPPEEQEPEEAALWIEDASQNFKAA